MRKRVKTLLTSLEGEHPGVRASLFAAMGNVMPAHLLDVRLRGGPQEPARGPDPWLDEEEAEAAGACGEPIAPLAPLGTARAAR